MRIVSINENQNSKNSKLFLAGGEMGLLISSMKWAKTPLGPIENWPQSLRTSVSTCLHSKFPILLWWGPEMVMLYNDAYRQILGKKHPGAMGAKGKEVWQEIWHIIGPMLEGVLQKGEATWSEDQLLLLERYGYAEECYFTFSYSPIHDESGGVGGIFCAVTETTEKVLGERKLRTLRDLAEHTSEAQNTEDVYRKAMDIIKGNTHDFPFTLLYSIETDGQTARLMGTTGLKENTSVSPSSIDLQAQDAAAWPIAEVTLSQRSAVVDHLVEEFGELPSGAWQQAPEKALVLPITQAGQEHPYAVLITGLNPHAQLDGNYQRFFTLVSDQVATALANARAYEEERKRAEALAEIDRAKTVFFSNVSHEFRTPLTLMLGPIEDMLNDPNIQPLSQERLEVAHRNALRLLKLVNALLDFSRIEAGRIEATFEPINLAPYTADLASNFRSSIEKAGIELEVVCPPLKEPVYADREMWEKIVLNLLSNAFKYTLQGKIKVALKQKNNAVELSVTDTGVGIPKEDLPHMFERFHRVKGTEGRTHEGTGIGLSLVQELVKLHGGTIGVKSTPGKGSIFTVSIPLGTKHLPKERISAEPIRVSTGLGPHVYFEEAIRWLPDHEEIIDVISDVPIDASSSPPPAPSLAVGETIPRILLADDNADMRGYVKKLLSQYYHVDTVANGKDALAAVLKQAPDLVLTDVMMPGLDGFGLLQALRANHNTRAIPVILLSARAGEEAHIEGMEAGADDYLVKPFSARELLARVGAQIELAKIRKKALAAAENERGRFYELFMQAPAIIAVLRGPNHVFELANPKYMQVVGKDRPLIGKTVEEALPEIKNQGFLELLDNVYKTGKPYTANEMSAKLARKGMDELEEVFLNFVYQPYFNQDNQVEGIFAHAVDVTEQVQARKKVEESEKRFSNILEQSIMAIAIFKGRKMRIAFANAPMIEVLGKGSDILEKDLLDVLPELLGQPFPQLLDEVYTTGVAHYGYETKAVLVRKGKPEDVYFNFVYQPYRETDNTISGITVLATDVTEGVLAKKKIEENEQNFRKVLLLSPSIFVILKGKEMVIDFVNQALLASWNKDWDIVGKSLLEVLPEFKDQPFPKLLEKVYATGEPHYGNEEMAVIIKSGKPEETYFNYVFQPIIEVNNIVSGITVMANDITDQVLARKQIEESEERFRALVTATSDVVYRMNLDWTEMRELEGLGFFSDTGAPIRDWLQKYIHPKDQRRVMKGIKEAIRAKSVFEMEHRVLQADGTLGWTFSRAIPILDANNEIIEWFGAASDVTVRRKAEDALRIARDESERRKRLYEAVTGSTPDLIYVFDLNYRFTFANEALLAMWGQTWEKAIGKGLLELGYEPWHAEMHEREIDEVVATKKPIRGEVSFPHASLGKRIYDYIFVPVVNANGEVEAVAGTTRDITELKLAEESLKESEERFRQLAESMPQLVWTTDADGLADYFNGKWFEYTGSLPEHNTGYEWTAALHPEDKEITMEYWMKAVKLGHPVSMEYRLKSKEGSFRWFLTRGIPQHDKQGKIVKWFGTSTDIDDQKKALEQKDEFMSIASHELKTPITSLKTSLQLVNRMVKEKSFDMIENFLTKAETQVDKLTGLVADLLDVSRIKTGKLLFNFTEFDVHEVINDCVEQESHQSKKHHIISHIDARMRITADKARLEQVIANLLSNAVKYSPQGDKVILRATKEDGCLKVSVTDFGIGIPKEKHQLVFDRFYRAQEAVHQFQGLGLGLYISNEIVKRHQGRMWVESEEGQGSTFYFMIPFELRDMEVSEGNMGGS